MASVKWSIDAIRDLEHIDSAIAKRIVAKTIWLGENFENIIPEPLHRELKGLYKLKIGDYRVEYSINNKIIVIEAVGHRRDIYR